MKRLTTTAFLALAITTAHAEDPNWAKKSNLRQDLLRELTIAEGVGPSSCKTVDTSDDHCARLIQRLRDELALLGN